VKVASRGGGWGKGDRKLFGKVQVCGKQGL
jgi:hypothetical protein